MTSKGEATRDAIVKMALVQTMEVGLESVSLGVLAASLGLSKSGLFAHFKSKEALQLAVLEEAIETFSEKVVTPALAMPRGEPRLRALFDLKIRWFRENGFGVGCVFAALEQEYDDRPGPIRDRLVQSQLDWHGALVKAASLAVRERHFASDADPEQIAFEVAGIDAAFRHRHKLIGDDDAHRRAMLAYERLVAAARPRKK